MKELLEKYPKAAKLVREYYLEELIKSLKDKSLPEEFKEHVRQQGITDDTVAGVISGNPVLLFSVFDENEIYIDIDVHIHENEVKFSYILPILGMRMENNKYFDTRKEAEQKAVEEAFEILEQKLQ